MRRTLFLVIFLLIFQSIAWGAEGTNHFKYQGSLSAQGLEEDFFILELGPSVLEVADPSFKDLRIYSSDNELSYQVLREVDRHNTVTEKMEVFNKGVNDNKYSFFIAPPGKLDDEELEYTVKLSAAEYLVKADIYGSNDRNKWKFLKKQTLYGVDNAFNSFALNNVAYDFIKIEYELPKEGLLEVKTVDYSRVRQVVKEREPKYVSYGITNENKKTQVTIDNQYTNFHSKRVVIETPDDNFYRQVTLEGKNDGDGEWQLIAEDIIFRDSTGEKLDVQYGPVNYRHLRLAINDEDNSPLSIEAMKVQQVPTYLLVNATNEPEGFIADVYWGDQLLDAPNYDINNLKLSRNPGDYQQFYLDNVEENPNFSEIDSRMPLTERMPWLMPLSLLVLALGAGVFLYRTVKQVG
ncbi:hypothetical protein MFMK1_001383 [Metallumcola ferriviriculae]|uniref:DUF3999 domain-containing protein n=1 Tax=Metallumcola ferriviriculae TaxID=3039180 RepID=A0AAU0ULW5_9FIRM|nr:hypothetical protein MFMK1_001383 [Desulfitibacteraceae bacterium MK1]